MGVCAGIYATGNLTLDHFVTTCSAFCAMMLAAGVPPVLAAMSLAYSVNLFGSITHYASGQVGRRGEGREGRGAQISCLSQLEIWYHRPLPPTLLPPLNCPGGPSTH